MTRPLRASNHEAVILTEMPDLLPRPLTPLNARFRREFYRRWGRENCVVSGTAQRAEYCVYRQALSLKCVARGTETYFVDGRRATVSDDTYLVLNEGRVYGSTLEGATGAYSFAIFFRPGMAREVAAALRLPLGRALDQGTDSSVAPVEFSEDIRAHDSVVTPVARFIQHHVAAGVRDEHWLEEQCLFLVGRMLRCQPGRQPAPMPAVADLPRPLQAEVQRRVGRAIDFMHEHMHRDIGLAQIAGAAHLSPFHFLRLFQRLQGRTPTAHLRMLRARRALALLESTGLDAGSIAQCVGLSRVALWRVLRETHGSGARKLRRGDTAGPTAAFLRAGDDSAA